MDLHHLAATLNAAAVVMGKIAFVLFIGLLITELLCQLHGRVACWPQGWWMKAGEAAFVCACLILMLAGWL